MSNVMESYQSSETYQEKAWRKFKQQPLVPLGAAATTFALIMAGTKLRKRDSKNMNYWLRARVITQGLTIVALVAGSWLLNNKQKAADAANPDGTEDELIGKELRKREFEERLRGAEARDKLENAAGVGRGPLIELQKSRAAAPVTAPEVKIPEAKSGSEGWGIWSWFGGSSKPPPTPAEDKKV